MEKIFALAPLLLAARERTGNQKLANTVSNGRFQMVEITYRKGGSSDVKPMCELMEYDEYVKFLTSYGT